MSKRCHEVWSGEVTVTGGGGLCLSMAGEGWRALAETWTNWKNHNCYYELYKAPY